MRTRNHAWSLKEPASSNACALLTKRYPGKFQPFTRFSWSSLLVHYSDIYALGL